MTIKIVLPEGNGVKACQGTKVFTESGSEIEGVSRIKMDMQSDCILEAEMTVSVNSIENLNGIEGIVIVDPFPPRESCHGLENIMKRIRRGDPDKQIKRVCG